MNIILEDLGAKVRQKLRSARSARIAIAYFRPDDDTLSRLKSIPNLQMVVSNEFDKSDPYKIEELSTGSRESEIRCVPVFPSRLHAKIIYAQMKNGSRLAFVGSANLTSNGLSQNREATIMLDSGISGDAKTLEDLDNWFEEVWEISRPIDFRIAKRIFDNAKRTGSQQHRMIDISTIRNWAIKTRPGQHTEVDYWDRFREEAVIAHGWGSKLELDFEHITHESLRHRLEPQHGSRKAGRIANEILCFAGKNNGINVGDLVWIIAGFSPNQKHPVDIYGVAKVIGDLQFERGSRWWPYKREAIIIPIERSLDIATARECFAKKAMHETLYALKPGCYDRLRDALHRIHGISIDF